MKITAIMPNFEEEEFLDISIKSIINYVDELIIIDNSSKDKSRQIIQSQNSDKIVFIQFDNMENLSDVMDIAIKRASNEWILRWDSDYIACDNIDNMIQLIKINNYDGFFFWYPNLYGDVNHVNKQNSIKTMGYAFRKQLITYVPSERFAYEIKFSSGNYCYLNDPNKNSYYFIAMTNCKNTHKIFYNCFKSQYWNWLAKQSVKITFREYFEKNHQKDYTSSLRWIEKTLCDNIVKHNYKLPSILKNHIVDPIYLIRYDTVTYRDYPHYKPPVILPLILPVISPQPVLPPAIIEKFDKIPIKDTIVENRTSHKVDQVSKINSPDKNSKTLSPEKPSSPPLSNITKSTSTHSLSDFEIPPSGKIGRRQSSSSGSRRGSHGSHTSHDIYKEVLYNYEITIIIYVNDTQYLKYAVESVLEQSSNKWKLIIVNDTGTQLPSTFSHDNILVIDPSVDNIKFNSHSSQIGSINSYKIAMENVTTDIVGILHAKDVLDQFAVESVLAVYNTSYEDVFVYTNFWYCDFTMYKLAPGNSASIKKSLLCDRTFNNFMTFKKQNYLMCCNRSPLITLNEDVDEMAFNDGILTNGYDEDIMLGYENHDLLFQLEKYAKPYFLEKYLYLQRDLLIHKSLFIEYLKNVSIIKNLYRRYGSFKPCIIIYSTKSGEIEEYYQSQSYILYGDSRTTVNFAKYYFELWSQGVYFTTLNYEMNKDFLRKNINSNDIPVKITWDNNSLGWIVSEVDKIYLTDFTIYTLNHYFDMIYYIGDEDMDVNFSYKLMESYSEISNDCKDNNYRKIMIISRPIELCSDFSLQFNNLIRSIPFDWNMLCLSNSRGNINGSIIENATSTDFTAIGFDCTLFDKLQMIGKIMKISGKDISLAGKIKGTDVIKILDKYLSKSYGYVYPLMI